MKNNLLKTGKSFLCLIATLIVFSNISQAQFVEDALRYAISNGMITPRSAGFGVAYHGVADDFSSVMYNPAGLSLVARSEINFGLGYMTNSTDSKFPWVNNSTAGTIKSTDNSDAYLSNFGYVSPFKIQNGNAAFAIGYVLESNFNKDISYAGMNSANSYTGYQTKYGTRNIDDNWAYHQWLADSTLKTPINGGLYQSGLVSESGGLHDVIGGIAFDLSENFSIGASLVAKWGNFKYTREYKESDVNNIYNEWKDDYSNLDFKQLIVNETIFQNVFGLSGSIGIQARIENIFRIGLSVKFPTFYKIDDDWTLRAQAEFDTTTFNRTVDGNTYRSTQPNPYDPDPKRISYDVTTPFVFSGGMSAHYWGITLAAGIEFNDVKQTRFRSAGGDNVTNINDIASYFEGLNSVIREQLQNQIKWGLGIEWDIPKVPIAVRGSISSSSSPYLSQFVDDGTKFSSTTYAFGAGFYVAPNIRLDGLLRWSQYSEIRTNYGDAVTGSLYKSTFSPYDIGIQITYRY